MKNFLAILILLTLLGCKNDPKKDVDESDSFKENETFTLSEVKVIVDDKAFSKIIYPTSRALDHLDTYCVDQNIKRSILLGQKLPLPETMKFLLGKPYKVMHKDELLAIYHIDPENEQQIRALRVFNVTKSEGD